MIQNKKGQIGFMPFGLIDASTLPKCLLYTLMFFIIIILLIVSIVLVLFIISWFRGDAQFMPFGIFGYYGMPIAFGSFSTNIQTCTENGKIIDCEKSNNLWRNDLYNGGYGRILLPNGSIK